MALKVDFLLRDELEFELIVRGVSVSKTDNVVMLRKKLREVVKFGIESNYHNLHDKLDFEVNLELMKAGLENLEAKVASLTDPPNLSEVSRIEARLGHYDGRIKAISKFKLQDRKKEDEKKEVLTKLTEKLGAIVNSFKTVQYDQARKEIIERKLSEANSEEENLNDAFEDKLGESNVPVKSSDVTPSSSMYCKLPNPAERHFKNLKVSDGLNARELLKFISTMLKVKDETDFTDFQILDISLSYASGPLYAKIIEGKNAGSTIDEVHTKLIDCFIPIGLRESLKRELVTRPQKMGEPLNIYILDVKENAKLLKTSFSERDLVDLIKIGLNPETRSRLVFVNDPRTFDELSQLCIHDQNVRFEDIRRIKHNRGPSFQTRGVNFVPSPKKCFVCGKVGHIARNCYSQGTQQEPHCKSNFPNHSSKFVPKNGAPGRASTS